MASDLTYAEAQAALTSIDDRRRQVIAEIGMPRGYWWAVAAGWVALGVVVDLGNPWATGVATLLFGAAHAALAGRFLSGRQASSRLRVRGDVVRTHVPAIVIGYLLVLAAVSTALGFLAHADGAEHPSTMASVVAAVAVGCGGPNVMAAVRRRAAAPAAEHR